MPIASLFPFLSFLPWPGRETDRHQQGNKQPGARDLGRFVLQWQQVLGATHMVSLYDPDTKRVVVVTLPNPDGHGRPAHDPELDIPVTKAAEVLTKHLDQLPPATVTIKVDKRARILSFSTDPTEDAKLGTDYLLLKEYKLPRSVANRTVLRSELYEIERLLGADIVSYLPNRAPRPLQRQKDRYAFKYWESDLSMWHEIQIIARLPRHPNRISLDRLVLDEQTRSKVVGFTTQFIAGGTLDKPRPRFKLKWLRQLMQAVDDLNLKHGIIHQDIAHRNLVIDSESDSLVLIDFGEGYRIGVEKQGSQHNEGRWGERDDVKGVLVFLYQYITRDPALEEHYMLDEVNEKDFMDPAKWTKHPNVELDDEVAEFHFELMAWVRGRRRAAHQMKHYTEAPQPLEWPPLPERAEDLKFIVGERRKAGLPFLEWRRPAAADVDPTRRLLATGKYADEEEEALPEQSEQATSSPEGSRHPSASASSPNVATGNGGSPSGGPGPNRRRRLAKPDVGTRTAVATAASGARAAPGITGARKRKHGDEPGSNGPVKTDTAADAGGPPKKLPRRSARLSAKPTGSPNG